MFFVDRVQEMSVLQTAYEKPESSLFVLYGRRRVGKTTLLSEFCKEKAVSLLSGNGGKHSGKPKRLPVDGC